VLVTDQKIEVGTIVHHPKRPAWGPAKALAVGGGGNVTLYFRDLEEAKPNDAVKTISTRVIKLDIADEQTDFMLENLPIFENGKFKGLRKPRLSVDQAVQAFIDKQPAAFNNPKYIEEQRTPRLKAHELWMNTLGDGQGTELLDAGDIAEVTKRLLKVDAKADLLSPQEKATLKRGLKHDEAGQVLRALMAVAADPEAKQSTYQQLIDAVDLVMETEPGSRSTNWSVVTQFPFIACPEHHFEFKPTVVQKCAARLNFDLRYSAALNWWTYERLLQLATNLRTRLEPIGAKDFIDVHWFMAVIATV
jgi:hypothetical protein